MLKKSSPVIKRIPFRRLFFLFRISTRYFCAKTKAVRLKICERTNSETAAKPKTADQDNNKMTSAKTAKANAPTEAPKNSLVRFALLELFSSSFVTSGHFLRSLNLVRLKIFFESCAVSLNCVTSV